jgi:hypothetical protein
MSSPGQRVIDAAMSRLGEHEDPWGSNRGPFVDMINARWGLRGTPWCGAFASWAYAEASVDDDGLCHPSTAIICQRARDKGAVWDGHHPIPPGAEWVNCGVHVALVVKDNGDGTVSTVEGNHHDAVALGRRAIADGLIVIPPAIKDVAPPPPAPIPEYWLEDTAAQPKLFGPWRSKETRDEQLATIPADRRAHARKIRGAGGGYAWLEGARRLYGPWLDKEARDAAQQKLEQRLGHGLRPFSRTVHGSV